MRPISHRQKDDVLALLLQGLSSREIAKRVGISHVSVQKIRKQSSHDIPIPTAGRPKRLTPEEAKRVARAVHVGRCKNARDAQRSLFHDSSSPPSLSTIRRALHDAGLKRYRRRKRPLLTKRHIRECLNFARQHAGWTAEDRKRVVWSDETKVNLYGPDGDPFYWGMKGEALKPRNVEKKVAHGGGHIMISTRKFLATSYCDHSNITTLTRATSGCVRYDFLRHNCICIRNNRYLGVAVPSDGICANHNYRSDAASFGTVFGASLAEASFALVYPKYSPGLYLDKQRSQITRRRPASAHNTHLPMLGMSL